MIVNFKSKKEDKYQESIQSSTTPDQGYQWESDSVTNIHKKREPRAIIHFHLKVDDCTKTEYIRSMALDAWTDPDGG